LRTACYCIRNPPSFLFIRDFPQSPNKPKIITCNKTLTYIANIFLYTIKNAETPQVFYINPIRKRYRWKASKRICRLDENRFCRAATIYFTN